MRHTPLILLAGLLLWAPLPYGSVTPGAVVAVISIVALALVAMLVGGPSLTVLKPIRGVLLALAAIGGLGLFQASSWAGRWLGFLSGVLPSRLPAGLTEVAQPTLSLAPALSRQASIGWWVLTLLLALSFVVGRGMRARWVLLLAAVCSLAFQGLYGVRQLRIAPYEVWGRVVSGPARLRGTLVNSDHLAVFFEIMLAVCIGWYWWAWRVSRREPRVEYRLRLLVPPVVVWLGCAVGVVASGSRAGLAAVVLGFVFQAALIFGPRRRWWVPITLMVVIGIGGWTLLSRGPSKELGRQLSRPIYEVTHSARFAVWGPALRLWAASPWIGTGLATFEEGFPRVQPAELLDSRWGRAHNDPLEMLVTGGLVGAGLLLCAVLLLIRRLWRVYIGGSRTASRAAALAALAALPPVAMHECFDFGLTVPANAILLTVLLGVGAAGPTATNEGAARWQSARERSVLP
jgi:O-antigen ligase